MKGYDRNCPLCRLMRSLAFAGAGMGIGSLAAYWYGTSKQNMMISGIVLAAIMVFGLLDNDKKKS